ncbi:MAG: recombinase family protein [Pseudomonadota bacterium]
MRLIGYARVSTDDQNPALQIDALRQAGVADADLYVERLSGGKPLAERPTLQAAIAAGATGDKLIVWKLDRLARSVRALIDITQTLEVRGVAFECLTGKVDTATPAGKFCFHVMAATAEFERALISERTREGLRAAQRRGVRLGKPPWPDRGKALALLAKGERVKAISKRLGCSQSVIRKHCKGHLPKDRKERGETT